MTKRSLLRASLSVLGATVVLALTVGRVEHVLAQTAWQSYADRADRKTVDQHLDDPILHGAVDLHAHHGPDSYPRYADGFEVAKLAQERGMRGLVLKNHWEETAGLAYLVRKYATPGFEVFGALSLDTPTGGMNPQAVRYMADITGHFGRIVWMPTHDSEHEVKYNKEDRPFVRVSRDGQLLPETLEVIGLLAKYDLTLATGHVTPEEALMIMREAKRVGVKHIIVTHPLLGPQFTYMTLEQQQESVKLGALIEVVAGNVTRPGEGKERSLQMIRALGANAVFVSSDSGLSGGANHTDNLVMAIKALREAKFSEADLGKMFRDNPARLINLPLLAGHSAAASPHIGFHAPAAGSLSASALRVGE